ncbi:hypothetical protein [Methanobacterium formicicum]|uniref:Uncharacterized protein n=1 Tax=Methanobacterium formicicum TaxID=2162 RepID=A0A843AU55_METFO|nr:hypothetical protein [Methanobacterium formicicum]MBF4474275.1 hypothetical protein [Methanobacterium formicicum]
MRLIVKILENALNDRERKRLGLAVTFVTKDKHPGFREWQNFATENQSEEEIKKIYNKRGGSNVGYSYYTGIAGLIDLDFDWEWSYYLASEHFGERFNSRTIRTPSGGYRVLFTVDRTQDYLEFKDRPPKVEIHGKKSHQVIVSGKGPDDSGKLKRYELIKDVEIRHDPDIIEDMISFLKEINTKCHFLEYNCIRDSIRKKHNELTHDQRTNIGAFFAAENIDFKMAVDFYRCTDDFNSDLTEYHLQKIYEKGFKHPKCKTLQEKFNHNINNCSGCSRNNQDTLETSDKSYDNDRDIFLTYSSEHLMGFDHLAASTRLFGKEYKLIFKVLWYAIFSTLIATKELRLGQIKTDGRLSVLFPIKSGGGKESLKNTIKAVMGILGKYCSEPTSLHAEQLVGKVIPQKKGGYIQNVGYFGDDYVIVDEGYTLLTSKELHYSEARKYIRTALDPYPKNVLTKRQTDIPREEALTYTPKCPVTIFLQPFRFDNDQLVMEGDIRRFIVPYVKMIGVDRSEAFLNRVFNDNDDEGSLLSFCETVKNVKVSTEYTFSEDARYRFSELSMDLRCRGLTRSEKIRYFTDNIEFTIQNFLLKFSVIQALQVGKDIVEVEHVELAYMDLFEVLEHTYDFIEAKIPGFMNYGEGWRGAVQNDQTCLRWLHQQTSNPDDVVPVSKYQNKVMKVFNVKERQARYIISKQVENGWIGKKSGHDSSVWLKFEPSIHGGNGGNAPNENSDNEFYYELLNSNSKIRHCTATNAKLTTACEE